MALLTKQTKDGRTATVEYVGYGTLTAYVNGEDIGSSHGVLPAPKGAPAGYTYRVGVLLLTTDEARAVEAAYQAARDAEKASPEGQERKAWNVVLSARGAVESAYNRLHDESADAGYGRLHKAEQQRAEALAAYIATYGKDGPSLAAERAMIEREREGRERDYQRLMEATDGWGN